MQGKNGNTFLQGVYLWIEPYFFMQVNQENTLLWVFFIFFICAFKSNINPVVSILTIIKKQHT